MNQIINNIKFKRNLKYILRTQRLFNSIIRFSAWDQGVVLINLPKHMKYSTRVFIVFERIYY